MPLSRRKLLALTGTAGVAVAGCTGTQESAEPTGTPAEPPPEAEYAYTHLRASGNRVVAGRGAIDGARPVEISVEGEPAWLLAFGDSASYWTVVTADGTATTYRVSEGASERIETHGGVSTPPLAYRVGSEVGVVGRPADCADLTHPVGIDGGLLYVATDGDVVLRRDGSATRLDVQAPVDARLVHVAESRYALYGNRTDRYRHGALGDNIEGSSLLVVDAATERVAVEVDLDPPTVFEGLSPLVADIDGDGAVELVTTVADSTDGARIRVYDTDGTELATGPVYGPGWRHQLCVAPFAPDGATELGVVRKPHVDRTVEFYRVTGDELEVTATEQGYASHTYASRNLDGGLAADLDADGSVELLVPTTDRNTLTAVRRVDAGARAVWSLPLGGSLRTNVTGVALDRGRVAVGAGTADGVRVWQG